MRKSLPPGQFLLDEFPCFGLGKFARRFPAGPDRVDFAVRGDVAQPLRIQQRWAEFPRSELQADFHCVTSWSVTGLRWSGVCFRDFYESVVLPDARPRAGAELVVLRGADGYRSSLPLEDVLNDDVLLADQLDGAPLGVKHGAPLRLVAPAHYGYKNVKHINAIEFWVDRRNYRFPKPYPRIMDHPRARVAYEERTQCLPGWLVRPCYRLLIASTIRNFRRNLQMLGHDDER